MSDVVKIKSPKGKLEWVTITGEGKENLSGKLQYVANIIIEASDPIIDTINEYWEVNKPKGFKRAPKSMGIYAHTIATDEKDEDGKTIYKEDGKKMLAFKTGTMYQNGEAKKIQIYNANAQKVELPKSVSIGNGTIAKISGAMGIYETKSKKGALVDAGVTLYLDAIQILKLEEFSVDAGFEVDNTEGGWTGDDTFVGKGLEPDVEPSTSRKCRL